jgi:hypothetical protein
MLYGVGNKLNLAIMNTLDKDHFFSWVEAVQKFAYFTANFPADFIERCWDDNGPHMVQHMRSKLKATGDNGIFVTPGDFMRFFFCLSTDHQIKLILWIDKNYTV